MNNRLMKPVLLCMLAILVSAIFASTAFADTIADDPALQILPASGAPTSITGTTFSFVNTAISGETFPFINNSGGTFTTLLAIVHQDSPFDAGFYGCSVAPFGSCVSSVDGNDVRFFWSGGTGWTNGTQYNLGLLSTTNRPWEIGSTFNFYANVASDYQPAGTAVPEPASLVLVAFGLAIAGGKFRRLL